MGNCKKKQNTQLRAGRLKEIFIAKVMSEITRMRYLHMHVN
jgi:hypothetical protein